MKLIRSTNTWVVFHLGHREAKLLPQILQLYPRVPPAHHVLTKSGQLPDQAANQQLLDEALAEQRAEHKRKLKAFLADPARFARTDTGVRLSLPTGEVEWLLQVLNDIRVGSWLSLGAPEARRPKVTETTAPNLVAMEMAGYFQAQLLEALRGEG